MYLRKTYKSFNFKLMTLKIKKKSSFYLLALLALLACNPEKESLPELNLQIMEDQLVEMKQLLKESQFGEEDGTYPPESALILENAIDELEHGLSKAKAGLFVLQYEPNSYYINALKAIENFHNTLQEKIEPGEPGELVVYGLNGGKIDFGDDPAYSFPDRKFTIETWVKFENGFIEGPMPTLLATFSDYGTGVREGWTLNIMGDLLRFSIACENGLHEPGFPYPRTWDQWIHLAVTFDESLSSNRIKVYLNGEQAASHNGGKFLPKTNNNRMWAFQEPHSGTFKALSGYMKKLSIWNVSKTPQEIKELMNSDVYGTEPDLLCAWDFTVVPEDNKNIPSIKDGDRFKAALSGSYKWKKLKN